MNGVQEWRGDDQPTTWSVYSIHFEQCFFGIKNVFESIQVNTL